MYKGLTQRAKLILTVYSQEEAKRFRSDQLLPEHILLAIIKEGEGIGFKVLKSLKINPVELQLEIEKVFPENIPDIFSEMCLCREGEQKSWKTLRRRQNLWDMNTLVLSILSWHQ